MAYQTIRYQYNNTGFHFSDGFASCNVNKSQPGGYNRYLDHSYAQPDCDDQALNVNEYFDHSCTKPVCDDPALVVPSKTAKKPINVLTLLIMNVHGVLQVPYADAVSNLPDMIIVVHFKWNKNITT